jgi:uncharacterized UPF0160 family protein
MLPILATHSGKFHCDEVFAYATLKLALSLHTPGEDHTLIRTRKPELIDSAGIVFDVGSIFDPATSRFDHHQIGAPLREDTTPYSAAGLIWQVYGERAVTALLPEAAQIFAPKIAAEIDKSIVRRIDEIDNGVSIHGPVKNDSLNLASLVGEFNPPWDHPNANGPTAGDIAFQDATTFITSILRRRVDLIRAKLSAEATILAAHENAADERILVLDKGMPWKNVVFSHNLPTVFAVSPASNGNWMVDTVPPEPGSFAQRVPFPEPWAGLQAQSLADASGVPDAVFVHVRRFVGAAKSRQGAIDLATKALAAALATA